MFPNILVELARKRMSRADLAAQIGMKRTTMYHKLSGRTEFTKSEMCAIRDFLAPKMSLDELFEECDVSK